MANRDILAIGTSAGGFDALRLLAAGFSRDFPASVSVTIHLSSQFRSALDAILTQSGPLPASFAENGEKFDRGHIYIAPAERHLIVENGTCGWGPARVKTTLGHRLTPCSGPRPSDAGTGRWVSSSRGPWGMARRAFRR